ncbi:MAG: hypothetical protein HGA37_16380, partial [Lentimicrobium sp.]|nr:hypothetical protein [Lentimicrobium sp.]
MKKPYILLLVFIMLTGILKAQDIPISGKVTSATDKQPIPGVTVLIKGTSKGTVTNLDGVYNIAASPNGVLVFSFVGMQKQEVPVNGQRQINLEMAEEKIDLGE